MSTPHRPDAQTPKDLRDTRNAAEHHLFRGLAIANVLQGLSLQDECQWNMSQPFTPREL